MLNSIRSGNISLFKIGIFVAANLYIKNPFVFILSSLYFLFTDRKTSLVALMMFLLVSVRNIYVQDFIPIGIVEYQKNSRYVVDKFLYKVALLTDEKLDQGDILYFPVSYDLNNNENDISKNIIYKGNDFVYLSTFSIRRFMEDRIDGFDENIRSLIRKIIYNINEYDSLNYSIGYGLMSYYFLSFLKRKSKIAAIIFYIVFLLLFCNELKLLLVMADILLEKTKFNRSDKTGFKLIILCLINYHLLSGFSLLLPLLFSLYGIFRKEDDFRLFLFMIESFFFGEISLLNSLFFRFFIKIRIAIFVLTLSIIVFPSLSFFLIKIIELYSYVNENDLSIRGSLSISGILMFILILQILKPRKCLIKIMLYVLILLSPFNNPLCHVSFIDVGQGDSTLIRYPFSRECVLIDTGSTFNYYKLRTFLMKEGIYKISHLIISHDDSDHNGNIDNLKNDFVIENIIDKGLSFDYKNLHFTHFDLGHFENDNDNSLVYLINIDGYSFLFTGDLSSMTERILIHRYGPLKIDFLKVSHHGSYTGSSEYFISSILPRFASISTNGQYDHPHKTVLDTLERYNVDYFITKNSGTINVYLSYFLDYIKTAKNEFVIIK